MVDDPTLEIPPIKGDSSAVTLEFNNPTDTETSKLGSLLKTTREQAGLTIEDAARQTKLHPRQIVALEQEDFAKLPEIAFVRGFTRSYARFLGLDPEPLVQRLKTQDQLAISAKIAKNISPTIAELPQSSKPNQVFTSFYWKLGASILTLLAIIALGVWISNKLLVNAPVQNNDGKPNLENPTAFTSNTPSSYPATPPKARENPSNPTNSPNADDSVLESSAFATQKPLLQLVTQEPAWVEIIERSGKTLIGELVPTNSTRHINGTPPLNLTIGNAKSVHLTYRGKTIDLAPHIKQEVAHLVLE